MDASNLSQRHKDNTSAAVRTSPPGSITSSPHTMIPPPLSPFAIAPAGRTHGLSAPLPQLGSRSPGGYNASPYPHSYGTSSTSPSTASGSLPEAQLTDASTLSAAGISPTHISSSALNAQKRAYRQRRKDPSCDACRERKVKCDATETAACSECSSRNHKCQFTKETNRRMSSIKQVQDLQSQLAELRQENTHLRTRVTDRNSMEVDGPPATHRRTESYSSSLETPLKVQPPEMQNFDLVCRNIRTYCHGIFDPPSQGHASNTATSSVPDIPDMPSRAEFAHLSRSYLNSIHEAFPIVHWPTFQHEVDQIYTVRSFEGTTSDWVSLFFAVMACGTLQSSIAPPGSPKPQGDGASYFEIASHALLPVPQDITLNHIRVAFLLSTFASESNRKAEGSMLLATAARMAQLSGLHLEKDSYPVIEGEMRRRLWWSIYARDRISSLSTNLPMLIHEEDCEVSLPSAVEDRYIQPHGFTRPRTSNGPVSGHLAVIHVARLYWGISRALKSSFILPPVLQSHDEKFHGLTMRLPDSCHLGSDSPLEPAALWPIFALMSARFLLYRHNLSPVSQPPQRSEALHRCFAVAKDTSKYVSRALRPPPERPESERDWQARLMHSASNMTSMHLWRCMLVLCFRADYEAALVCLRLASAIGDLRRVNTACGKHLAFFLDRLQERVDNGTGAPHHLENDEEMIAYVSGDMQGSLEHAWVWPAVAPSPQNSPQTSPPTRLQPYGLDESMQGTNLPIRPISEPSHNGTKEWDGWVRIEQRIRQLMDKHRARIPPPPSSYYPPPHNPVKRVQLAPGGPISPNASGPIPSPTPSSASRISIANII